MEFYFLLLIISFLYAGVGHGGASGYLALMALYDFLPEVMKPTALVLNVLVSAVAFVQFYKAGYFKWQLFWPLIVGSIPMAFVGGMFTLEGKMYKMILGILLIFSIIRIIGLGIKETSEIKKINMPLAITAGAIIGLLSGLIGIGGGIILSPLLILLKWGKLKEVAAVSALFILVNSASGLLGMQTQGVVWSEQMPIMISVAFVGGLLGAYYGALKFNVLVLKNILAFVLLVASLKLIIV
jgi:uncharacterized membrane protein YfcA